MKKAALWLLSGFQMDLRSLALFRIVFGSCLFIDVFYRLFYVDVFYTDSGVLPRDALISNFLNIWEWTLFNFNGQALWVGAMMVVLLGFIVSFTLGFYTRFSAIGMWILLVSMYARNQVILHGGDDVARCLSFWCMFAPLGAEFSLDRYLNPSYKPASRSVLTFGAAGLMMQLLFVYFFTGLLKWDPIWWTEGSAVYYTLNLDEFTSSIGRVLRQFPGVMKTMTFSTLILEMVGPVLVILPAGLIRRFFSQAETRPFVFLRPRILIPLAFITFHFGLAMTMVLGMFPWTCMAAWLMVLPAEFWNQFPEPSMKWLKKLAEKIKGRFKNVPHPRTVYGRFSEIVAGIFVFLVCVWNITQLDFLKLEREQGFRQIMHMAEIYQRWSMFAPYPRKDDGWYVMESKLFSGDVWNTFADEPVTYDKPDDVAGTYKNSMWRKYLTNLWLKSYNKHRVYLGRYLCRSWNDKQDNPEHRIKTIHIYYMVEMTPPPGEPIPEPRRELVWRHYCFDKPDDWVD